MSKLTKCPIIRAPCPQSRECPCWNEITVENVQTGETAIQKDCLFRLLPQYLIQIIKASNRPAAAVESMRNEMAKGLGQVVAIQAALAKQDEDPPKIIHDA